MIIEDVEVKTVPRFPDYAVSRDGKIWSKPRKRLCNLKRPGKYRFYPGRWLKYSLNSDGYLHVTLCRGRKKYNRPIHRLILETWFGFRPIGRQCRHLDGNKLNNRLDNLRWGTGSENQLDRNEHGVGNIGEQNPSAKLTEEKVRIIRYLGRIGMFTARDIAWQFGVSRETISAILTGRNWRKVS